MYWSMSFRNCSFRRVMTSARCLSPSSKSARRSSYSSWLSSLSPSSCSSPRKEEVLSRVRCWDLRGCGRLGRRPETAPRWSSPTSPLSLAAWEEKEVRLCEGVDASGGDELLQETLPILVGVEASRGCVFASEGASLMAGERSKPPASLGSLALDVRCGASPEFSLPELPLLPGSVGPAIAAGGVTAPADEGTPSAGDCGASAGNRGLSTTGATTVPSLRPAR